MCTQCNNFSMLSPVGIIKSILLKYLARVLSSLSFMFQRSHHVSIALKPSAAFWEHNLLCGVTYIL
jgi:hypothetical protein